MHFDVITVFPQMVSDALRWGVVGRAMEKNIFSVNTVNPRDFTEDVHKTIDDRPFGGGDGMVMLFEPLAKACASIAGLQVAKKIFLSPTGRLLNDQIVEELSREKHIILLSGRYGGVDQRVMTHFHFDSLSVGDYVLSGGEVPAITLIDAIARKLPGVLGHADSAEKDSLALGKGLEAPLFTRPRETVGGEVPAILLSGDHKKMDHYRAMVGRLITLQNRPDLVKGPLTQDEEKQLRVFIKMQPEAELVLQGLRKEFLERF